MCIFLLDVNAQCARSHSFECFFFCDDVTSGRGREENGLDVKYMQKLMNKYVDMDKLVPMQLDRRHTHTHQHTSTHPDVKRTSFAQMSEKLYRNVHLIGVDN